MDVLRDPAIGDRDHLLRGGGGRSRGWLRILVRLVPSRLFFLALAWALAQRVSDMYVIRVCKVGDEQVASP